MQSSAEAWMTVLQTHLLHLHVGPGKILKGTTNAYQYPRRTEMPYKPVVIVVAPQHPALPLPLDNGAQDVGFALVALLI